MQSFSNCYNLVYCIVLYNSMYQTNIRLRQGDFGEADQKIVEETGQKNYNVEISYDIGVELVELGIVHKNGKKITTKTLLGHGIGCMEWM